MRYKIEGESQVTRQAVTVIVEADSTLGARTQAADMGIDIVTLGVVDEADYSGQEPMPIRPAVSHRSPGVIALVIAISLMAILMIFGATAFMFLAVDSSPTLPAVQVTQPAPVLIDSAEGTVPLVDTHEAPDPPELLPSESP